MLGGIIFQLSELQFAAHAYLSILTIVCSCAGSFHDFGGRVLCAQRHRQAYTVQIAQRQHRDTVSRAYVDSKANHHVCCAWIHDARSAHPVRSFVILLECALKLLHRSIYRTIELADGWNGRIISTEVYFSACA